MRNAWREISRHPRRYAAVLAATMISTAFLVGSLVFVATSTHALGVQVSEQTARADLVVTPAAEPDWRAVTTILRATPGVAHAEPQLSAYAAFGGSSGSGYLRLTSLPQDPRMRWGRLAEGRWPAADEELAVTAGTARDYGLAVGQRVPISDGFGVRTYQLTLTGLIAEPRSLFDETSAAGVVELAFLARWPTASIHLVLVDPDLAPATVAPRLKQMLPPDALVQTADDHAAAEVSALTDGTDLATIMVLAFGGVALVAGAMIIANTFSIVVAQRRRQIGLLRVVGATGRDVRRGVWLEALIIGLSGSAAGVGLGLLAGTGATAVSGALDSGLSVPWGWIAAAALAGLLVTLAAAVLPARRAIRIPPLAALSPAADPAGVARAGRLRTVGASALMVVGALLVVVAFRLPDSAEAGGLPLPLLLAMAGCALAAFGILAAAPVAIRPVLHLLSALARRGPLVIRLAVVNASRHPHRTAAGTVALMLAVGLIVTLQVGAASARASVLDEIDRQFPVDLMVSDQSGTLDPALADQIRAVPGIAAVSPVVGTMAEIQGRGPDDGERLVSGLRPDARSVVTAGFDQVRSDVVLAHPFTLESARLTEGQTLTLVRGRRTVQVVVHGSDVAAFGGLVTTAETVARLAPDPPVHQLWAAAAPGADARTVVAGVAKVLAAQPEVRLEGSLERSASLGEVLDTMVLVATTLLAVAALIAMIGVGNTLGLSVIERRQESALLRALGLQRRQLRTMLAVEAVLLALIGSAIGIGAGVLFGAIGAAAMLRAFGPLRLAVPAADLAVVVGVSVLAGVLASVLPGRRAARESPIEALAAE